MRSPHFPIPRFVQSASPSPFKSVASFLVVLASLELNSPHQRLTKACGCVAKLDDGDELTTDSAQPVSLAKRDIIHKAPNIRSAVLPRDSTELLDKFNLRNAHRAQLSLTIALSTKIHPEQKVSLSLLICTLSRTLNRCNNGASSAHACVNALNTFAICNCPSFVPSLSRFGSPPSLLSPFPFLPFSLQYFPFH